MLPCLLGYGMIAQRLYDDPNTVRENNKYWEWILAYVDEKYKEAVRTGSGKQHSRISDAVANMNKNS